MTPDHDDYDTSGLEFALSLTARVAMKSTDPEPFMAWMRDHGVGFFIEAGMVPDLPKTEWLAVGTLLGRALWNHLPHPENDFKPIKLPEPGRNDPCPCGSGRKYKQCCGGVGMPPLDFSQDLLLASVLEHLTNKDLGVLPRRRFSPEVLAEVARAWNEKGEHARARLLLEPLFAEPSHLDGRHAMAFDVLMDIYLDLDMPKKRKALLATGLASADRTLRATARQRQAVMAIDAGDSAGAWAAFQAAQRDDPDDPNLAALELSLLHGEDNPAQMQERARFWAARLKRRPDAADLRDMIAMLEQAGSDPGSFADRMMAETLPELDELARLAGAMPPIARPPRIDVLDDGSGIVEANAVQAKDLSDWQDLYEEADARLLHAWLAAHPEAWDSPDVLDDIAGMLETQVEPSRWLDRHLLAPLYQRARELVDAALGALPEPPRRIEWGFWENRSLLSLLLYRAHWLARQGYIEAALGAAEELIAWNPNDNQGVRDFLGIGYARTGRFADLLALAERYPDDYAATRYNLVLALYALDRRGEALTALADVARELPKPLKMLLADNPKLAKPDDFGIQVGGAYEAWLYREAMLDVWRASGALDWLRACAPALKGGRRQ